MAPPSRTAAVSLCLESAPCKQLAFEGGEETLAHGIVVGIADRAHRGAHAGITAAATEFDRGILRPLVGVMDHLPGPSCRQRHVQGIEHQLFGECRGHRPADNATAIRIEHDREIEKAYPCRDVGDVSDPQPSGASAVKLRSTRSGAWRPPSLTVVVTNLRRLHRQGRPATSIARSACGQREDPWRQARRECAVHRRCRARLHVRHGSPRSASRLSRHAATDAA